eukprot:TRINITY_DN14947_c0_g1_i5.p1 TRINITY_DN14947_c0_g1~~TRINITY_DN14947_c0_g1_i5.p1  ORF type:complete len:482 (-),score=52.80 TRINITY_DN14947_c0_g1_i5:12-1457(-)
MLLCVLVFCFVSVLHAASFAKSKAGSPEYYTTPLDTYVNAPDNHYRYEQQPQTINGAGWTGRVYKMWSQQWLTPQDWFVPNSPNPQDAVWWHYLVVIEPLSRDPNQMDKAFLYITSGSNFDNPPIGTGGSNGLAANISVTLGIVSAVIYQVPNQPITFYDDPTQEARYEDAVIAWTWNYYAFHTDAEDWPLRLPMTKAAVRAMDTVSTVAQVSKFLVAGASKRGWTTWTTGLVDSRVIGIAPIVMDLGNMIHNLHHMYRSYNGWTAQFYDYWVLNMTRFIDHPGYNWLARIEDFYTYMPDPSRYNMAKLIITAANDEFFQPDNDHWWWPYLPGLKHRLMVPNSGHSIPADQILPTIAAWGADLFYRGGASPAITWDIDLDTGDITVTNDPTNFTPSQVRMWAAPSYAPTGLRDWRANGGVPVVPQNVVFQATTLTQTAPNKWVASQPRPANGWVASQPRPAKIGRAVQQECRDRSRMPSSA